jgi:hypothetical protein
MAFPTNITVYDGIATFEDGTQIEATVEQLRALPDLVKALEFYANADNWKEGETGIGMVPGDAVDYGVTARKVLAKLRS